MCFLCMLQGAYVICLSTHVQVSLVRILALVYRLVSLGIGVFVQKGSEVPIVRKKNRVSILHCIEYGVLLGTMISCCNVICFHSLAMFATLTFTIQECGTNQKHNICKWHKFDLTEIQYTYACMHTWHVLSLEFLISYWENKFLDLSLFVHMFHSSTPSCTYLLLSCRLFLFVHPVIIPLISCEWQEIIWFVPLS